MAVASAVGDVNAKLDVSNKTSYDFAGSTVSGPQINYGSVTPFWATASQGMSTPLMIAGGVLAVGLLIYLVRR